MTEDLSRLAAEAQRGSRDALEALVRAAQQPVYNLALRMLQRQPDAEDATQEILIKLVTHLSQFRAESAFSTWMYRVASNHLLNARSRDRSAQSSSFEQLGGRIAQGLAAQAETPEERYEQVELLEETRRSCTLGMLQCLAPEERMALILAELLEVDGAEGAAMMGVSPAAYRKRVSRARQSLVAFVSGTCGIVNPANPCRCARIGVAKIRAGQVDPAQLRHVEPLDAAGAAERDRAASPALDAVARTAALMRAHPSYTGRAELAARIERVVRAVLPPIQSAG